MAKTVRKLTGAQARVLSDGCLIEILAAEGADAKGPKRFKMVLYTGAPLQSGYWGPTYLDVSGFKASRKDLPVLRNHDRDQVAGFTRDITADVGAKQIVAQGLFLSGSDDEEPTAAQITRRMAQGHPYQASGRWVPRSVEEVQAGASATCNGETVNGPCTIFREFGIVEGSICEMGADGMTQSLAAAAGDEQPVNVTIEGEKTMTTPGANKTLSATLLVSLKDIFGGDKAIDLQASKPEAADVLAFLPDIVTEVKGLRAALATAETKNAQLEKDLATAKAAPAVILATKGDASAPVVAAKEDKDLAAAACKDEAQIKAEYENSPDIRAQYSDVKVYAAYRAAYPKPAAKAA